MFRTLLKAVAPILLGTLSLSAQNSFTGGWHADPGHTLIIVTAGTVTHYEAHDPKCTPHVYTAGVSFVDRGGSHVHIVRNEGSV